MAEQITYRLARGGQHYGPYTLDQLREYVKQGTVLASELVWCAGMPDWVPLGDVLNSTAQAVQPPPPLPPPPSSPGAETIQSQAPTFPSQAAPSSGAGATATPRPPALHWAVVLLLTVVTLGIFGVVWSILQARWVRRIDSSSNALFLLLGGFAAQIVLTMVADNAGSEFLDFAASPVGLVTWIVAFFSMRRSIEWHYALSLSGIMTFFFNMLYLQYHMTRITQGQVTPRVQPS